MAKKRKKTKNKKDRRWHQDKDFADLFIPGGIFLGMGFGFIYNNIPAGFFIGLGIGFIGMAIAEMTRLYKKR